MVSNPPWVLPVHSTSGTKGAASIVIGEVGGVSGTSTRGGSGVLSMTVSGDILNGDHSCRGTRPVWRVIAGGVPVDVVSGGASRVGRGTRCSTGGSAPPRQYTQNDALDALYAMGATAGRSRSSDKQGTTQGLLPAGYREPSVLLSRVFFYVDPPVRL
eukprot:SAG25_NODE_79_length_16803_cov_43.538194_19_plen_158_part_00